MRRAGDGRGERDSHVHDSRGVRGRHSQLSSPHDGHTTARRSSFPRLKAALSRRESDSLMAASPPSSRDILRSRCDSADDRTVGFFIHGSRDWRPDRERPAALSRSASLIFRQGLPNTVTASLAPRSRSRGLASVRGSSMACSEASGEERSLRGRPASGRCEGEGAGSARGRSECERARGGCVRLAGVTSLSDRRWIRRRTPTGESVSVTFMLIL